jgi:hypothetical protein
MLMARGFERYPFSTKGTESEDTQVAFPFGCMKRAQGAALEIIEIQFDKRGTAQFVINFGKIPPEGVSLPWGHFGQNEIGAAGLPDAFRLYSVAKWSRWFSLGWFARNYQARAAKAVNKVISLYPEVESWFASGVVGPHIRRFGFPSAPVR